VSNPTSQLTAQDLYDIKVNEIERLIKVTISAAQVEQFHRPITLQGPKPTKFPAIFVQPDDWQEDLNTSVKYDFWGSVILYAYAGGNQPAATGQECKKLVSMLAKLFSNNAMGDRLQGMESTKKYLVHTPFWIESRFGPVKYSGAVGYQLNRSQSWAVGARINFKFFDVLTH